MNPRDEPIRDDHAELLRRRALTEDAARPDAVERRHASYGRTARENIEDLVDTGTFVEYGSLMVAARSRCAACAFIASSYAATTSTRVTSPAPGP